MQKHVVKYYILFNSKNTLEKSTVFEKDLQK